MKNIAQGLILTVISILLIVLATTVSVRDIRGVRIKEQLTTAVDNAVQDTIDTKEYTINDDKEFVAAVLEEVIDTYYTEEKTTANGGSSESKVNTEDKVTIAINKADKEKGLLSVTAQVEYKKPNGKTGRIEYTRTCVLEDNETEGFSNIVYKYDKKRVYRAYTVENNQNFPVPSDPHSEEQGKIFVGWLADENHPEDITNNFDEKVNGDMTFIAKFADVQNVIHLTGIKIDSSTELEVGDVKTLIPTYEPITATIKRCTWTSDNEAVAKVNSNGKVEAISQGETNIVATSVDGNLQAVCHVSVKEINNITATPSFIATTDKKIRQNFNFQTKNGGVIPSSKVSLSSSNSNVVGIMGTAIDGHGKLGYSTVTAKYNNSNVVKCKIPVFIYSVKGYSGDYDGNDHSIEVKCDNTKTEVTYAYGQYTNLTESPKFSEPGEYEVTYTISSRTDFKEDGTPYSFSGTEIIKINGIEGNVSLSKDSVEITYPHTEKVKVTANSDYIDNLKNVSFKAYKADSSGNTAIPDDDEENEIDINEIGAVSLDKDDKGKYYINISSNGEKEDKVIIKCIFPAFGGYEEIDKYINADFKFGNLVKDTDFKLSLDEQQISEVTDKVFNSSFDYDGETHLFQINEIGKEVEVDSDFESNVTPTTPADGSAEDGAAKSYIYKEGFKCAISDTDAKDENGNLIDKSTSNQASETEAVVNPLQFTNAGEYVFYFEIQAKGYNKYFGKINVKVNKVDIQIKASNIEDIYFTEDEQAYTTDDIKHNIPIYIETDRNTYGDEIDKEVFATLNAEANKDNPYLDINPVMEDENSLVVYVKPKKEGIKASTKITLIRPESTNYKQAAITIPYTIGNADGIFDENGNFIASYAKLVNSYNLDITKDLTEEDYKDSDYSLYNLLKNKTLTHNEDDTESTEFGPSIYADAVKFIVPDTLNKIGSRAFHGCSEIKNVVIPSTVEAIGANAFDSDMTICYTGNVPDDLWGAKQLHDLNDANECSICGYKAVQIEGTQPDTENGNQSTDENNENSKIKDTENSQTDTENGNQSADGNNTDNKGNDTENSTETKSVLPSIHSDDSLMKQLGQVIRDSLQAGNYKFAK